MLEKAVRAHRMGDFDDAKQLCLKILAIDVRQADALDLLGMVEFQAEHYEAAERMLHRAIAADEQNSTHYANLGIVLQVQARFDEAAEMYSRALRLKPQHVEALHNLGNLHWKQGRLEDARGLLAQAIALRPNYTTALNSLGAVLRDMGRLDEAREKLEQALTADPDSVDALSNLGAVLRDMGRLDEAERLLKQALNLNPDYAEAYSNLGAILRGQGKLDEARRSLDHALALRPNFVEALGNLGNVLLDQGNLDQAVLCFERAIALNPARAEGYSNLGNALRELGRMREALQQYDRALALLPDYADAQWNRSLALLQTGNFTEGWRGYEWRFQLKDRVRRSFSQPQWHGEPLAGSRILLHAEQGLGDTLQFLRYAPLVHAAGGTVYLEVPARLRRLAEEMLCVAEVIAPGDTLPETEWHCPLMSLPLAMSTTLDCIPAEVPYLTVPPEARERADSLQWAAGGLRVGLLWSGSSANTKDRFRSVALEQLAPLFAVPGVLFYSLQIGRGAEQLEPLKAQIMDLAPVTDDMADTAAQITHLDLVITVDTSIAHLAGALSKPVWVILPFSHDWRWLQDRQDSPWYPSMRLFRQPSSGDWSSVVQQIQHDLAALAEGNRSLLTPEPASAAAVGGRPADEKAGNRISETERRLQVIAQGGTDRERWADPGQLEQTWDARARHAADYIPAGATVLDLGCGRMALEGFLPADCSYIPCDLVARDRRTVVCDFNAAEFPDTQAASANIVSMLGVMEYIYDAAGFLQHLRQWQRPVVMSYCVTDAVGNLERRRGLGWVNDLSFQELVALFEQVGFGIQRADRIDSIQWLFRLQPEKLKTPPVKRVGVLSFYSAGNFGDRLGYHLLNEILPANAEVTHLSFKSWQPPAEPFDLLVVGTGNSLFGSYLSDQLLALAENSHAAIGIFGTQYHEFMPRTMLRELVSRLDHWYARYEDDLLRYARGLSNASHLGDWLIKAFPLTRPIEPGAVRIGKEIWNDLPLDRTIQHIQRYTTVFSERIHPLLCALTSAEKVGYREQREEGEGMVSGKFRALLLDVFGRTFPEETLFDIDRSQVLRYKSAVDSNVSRMQKNIYRLLDVAEEDSTPVERSIGDAGDSTWAP